MENKKIYEEINETDADNVGEITKIELFRGNTLLKTAENLSVRSFDGLLSNNTYTVKVTYVYNLNDGEGKATAWGCDLTYDYVKINGDYRT